jgi:L-fuculose-phosphate aldolase
VQATKIDYRDLVARGVRVLNSAGAMHMSGHLAVRDAEDPNVLWINSRISSRSTLTAADVLPYDIRAGRRIGAGDEAPSEVHMHSAIFALRPDVNASVHTHPEYCVALSIAGIALQPVFVAAAFLPEIVPTFDDPNLIQTRERGDAVARVLGDGSAVTLRGHGVIVVGGGIDEVVARTVMTEENARLQTIAASLGKPIKVLGAADLAISRPEICSPHWARKHTHYHEEVARTRGVIT